MTLVPRSGTPDFRIYTASMEIDALDSPYVRMVGSSTEQDVQKNRMARSAIADMTQDSLVGMNIFLNHSYNLPYDLYGMLAETPRAVQSNGFIDVSLSVKTDVDNPPALQTLRQIRKGAKHGCSIGCMVLDWDFAGESDDPFNDPVVIKRIQPVEWSVVGIPANRRSWVENAISGIFTRSLAEGNYDEAYKLAPSMKSLYSHNYEQLVLSLSDGAERRRFTSVRGRPTADYTVMWEPPRRTFVLANSYGQPVDATRDQIARVLREGRIAAAFEEPAVTLAADDAAKKAQEARSRKYHIGIKEGGNVTKPSQWSSVPDSEWGDPVNYRYPMPNKAHADNAASRWGDAANRAQYSSEEQSIIGGRITRRQSSFGESSDDTKEKAMPPELANETETDLTLMDGGPGEVGGEVKPAPAKKPRVPHVDENDTPQGADEAKDYNDRDLGAEQVDGEQHTQPNDAHSNAGRANNAGNDAHTANPAPNKAVETDVLELAKLVAAELQLSSKLAPDHEVHVRSMHDHANAMLGGRGCSNMSQKKLAPDHQVHAQSIHDHAAQMAGGKHCAADPDGDGIPDKDDPRDSDAPAQKPAGKPVPQAEQQAKQSKDGTPDVALAAELDALRSQLAAYKEEATQLNTQILQLQGRGLGRPTLFTGRQMSIPTTPVGVDMQVQTPEELRKLTTLRVRADGVRCRHWPEGVGAMQRPELSARQMSLMSSRDEDAYYAGRDVLVPILSDED